MTQTFDYVVVGAGSAGAVVASRLSEDEDVTVLLVEAGGASEHDVFSVPSQWGRQIASDADWRYLSEPEPALRRRRLYLPRGKGLGGSSAMNAMLYVRGTPSDFDGWSSSGVWAWEEVLPYFKKAESNERGGSALHGDSGPLGVGNRISDNPLVEAWVQAGAAAGYPLNADFNGDRQEGVGVFQLTQRSAERSSSATAYLTEAVKRRPNLTIMTYTRVTTLLMDGARVTGVALLQSDSKSEALSAREVIVCAGAYNAPQILMLSGIGPAEHLRSIGITPVVDLPVGENLQDHPGVPYVVATAGDSMYGTGTEEHWEQYRTTRSGPVSSNLVEGGAFLRSHAEVVEPDIEMIFLPQKFSDDGIGAADQHAFTLVTEVLRPTSVGTVTLRNADPTAQPRIIHNHFATDADRAVMRVGMRMALDILEQAPLAAYETERLLVPGDRSDASLDEFISEYGMGWWHPVGTCSIGAVVDDELRVKGVAGLRVADGSVLPAIVGGNPNAAIIMIGERVADFIKSKRG